MSQSLPSDLPWSSSLPLFKFLHLWSGGSHSTCWSSSWKVNTSILLSSVVASFFSHCSQVEEPRSEQQGVTLSWLTSQSEGSFRCSARPDLPTSGQLWTQCQTWPTSSGQLWTQCQTWPTNQWSALDAVPNLTYRPVVSKAWPTNQWSALDAVPNLTYQPVVSKTWPTDQWSALDAVPNLTYQPVVSKTWPTNQGSALDAVPNLTYQPVVSKTWPTDQWSALDAVPNLT